jgi:tripartite-type tricarboxylate transporter receptor subunit TctC
MRFLSTALVDQDIKSGLLRAIGVSSKVRVPEFPDVPDHRRERRARL